MFPQNSQNVKYFSGKEKGGGEGVVVSVQVSLEGWFK